MDAGGHTIDAQLSSVASAVRARLVAVSQDVWEQLIRNIPELRGDDVVVTLLSASVEGNVTTLLHLLENGIVPEDVDAPTAALEYARRLAQRDMPLHALLRAYRVGHGRFLATCLEEVALQVDGADEAVRVSQLLLDVSFRYIDRISERVIGAYQEQRDRWLLTRTAARAARVRQLLADTDVDVDATEASLGYRLRRPHLGLVRGSPNRPRAARDWRVWTG